MLFYENDGGCLTKSDERIGLNQTSVSGLSHTIPAIKRAHIKIPQRCWQVRNARNLLHVNYALHGEHKVVFQTQEKEYFIRIRGGGNSLNWLKRVCALNRVWFSGSCVLNRVYNFTIYSILNRLSFWTRSLEQVVNIFFL